MEKENALKILRELHDKALFSERIALETFIPELKDSEGKKIMEEIRNFIYWSVDRGSITAEQREKSNSWLAWLEKQATPQMVEDAFLKGCNDTKKSLLKRQGEKKPAEWSEEDNYNLQCMIAKVSSDIQKGNVGRNNELIDWLKSLKDRNLWKPSDEQITVLELASKYERVFTPKQIDILIDLKEQLKKLKGE